MNGRVKTFNSNRGFGFILGDDREDYFFHISQVKSARPIEQGVCVAFKPTKGLKGRVALDINVTSKNTNTPLFITLCNRRIKISSIKQYGIGQVEEAIEKRTGKVICQGSHPSGYYSWEYTVRQYKYLYINTYQGDWWRFRENELDIYKKCKELDRYLT